MQVQFKKWQKTVFNTAGYTKLIVIGGYNNSSYLNSVEVVDLENPSNTCNFISDYPVEEGSMTVGINDGLIKSCGGNHDTDDCYDYDPETSSWITSASLINARYKPRSSFVNGIWLVSGDDGGSVDFPLTTEIWTGTEFMPGPSLPIGMSFGHCQLTINSTHVFFVDTHETGNAFLLDWPEQTWTELPTMTLDRTSVSCGLINNPENGIEAVIVEDGVTEIFSFRDETWRTGPATESFYEASYAQIRDSFVVVGGYSFDESDESDRIYMFDHINYEWILMSQRLQVPRRVYPGVVAVPDEFVTCS